MSLDPVHIRQSLEQKRHHGWQFDRAWETTMRDADPDPTLDTPDVIRFMRKHFEAAYYGDLSENGRCMVPPRDVSSAVPARDFTASKPASPKVVSLPKATREDERCKSGDGCDRLATMGRYGKSFCAHHGAELERVAGMLRMAREKSDPRNGGNTSLYTHQAA